MKRLILVCASTLLALSGCGNGDAGGASSDAWVTADRLNRRTCPEVACGSVGVLFFRDGVTVYEQRNGWVRVSRRYDASCYNGESEYVDSGNDACSEDNGIVDGQFGEWVSAAYLSSERPDAQREPVVQPDAVTDDLRRKSVAAVALRIRLHPRSLAGAVSS